jgi:diguanylate cyclase (GGDEF)-like protein
MVRSLKRLHTAALIAVLACLLLAAGAGTVLFLALNGSLTGTVTLFLALILLALGAVAAINIALYRTIADVRLDIRSLVQMFNDVHRGTLRPDYPAAFTEFAVAQRYLRGWGRALVMEKQRLTDMGLVDHLSQLSNRRHFEIRLKEIFEHARTHGPSAVLLLDLDQFKQVNDRHGHDAGDELIVSAAAALRHNVRHTDVLARLGGDEFCIVYAYTPLATAADLAERLRRALPAEIELKSGVRHPLRWSGGLSVLDETDTKPDDVLRRADRALLQAKEAGRNRTVIDAGAAPTDESIAS